jgi:hypothetical protein
MKQNEIQVNTENEHSSSRDNYQQSFLLNIEANEIDVQRLKESLLTLNATTTAIVYIFKNKEYPN